MRIIVRNYRTTGGEVDLIARDGDAVVFVEVKTRRRGAPAEAVTPEKQRRLTLAAMHFLRRHRLLEHSARFDVVAVLWPESGRSPIIEHYRDAFPPIGRGQMFH
jgi:putative endonuclease